MLKRLRHSFQFALIGIVLLVATTPCVARAQEVRNVETAITGLADEISAYLKAKGQNEIKISSFLTAEDSTAGRELDKRLRDRLAPGIKIVTRGAKWLLAPKFSVKVDEDKKIAVMSLQIDVLSAGGGVEQVYSDDIELTLEEFVRFRQPNVSLEKESAPEGKTPEEQLQSVPGDRVDETLRAPDKPNFHFVSDTVISPEEGSNFHMEVLKFDAASSKFVPVSVKNDGGFAIAQLAAGDVFELRLYNNADHDVSVEVFMDGINVFELSEVAEFKELGRWVVERKTAARIKGWYLNATENAEFEVTNRDDTALLNLPPPLNEGAITATFYHAWTAAEKKPFVELIAATERKGLRVGNGKRVKTFTDNVERFFGTELLASMTIRYDLPQDLPEEQPLAAE